MELQAPSNPHCRSDEADDFFGSHLGEIMSLDVPLTEVVGRRARDFARGLAQRIGYSKRRRAECNAPSFQFNTNVKKSWQERLEIATGRFAGTFNEKRSHHCLQALKAGEFEEIEFDPEFAEHLRQYKGGKPGSSYFTKLSEIIYSVECFLHFAETEEDSEHAFYHSPGRHSHLGLPLCGCSLRSGWVVIKAV